MLTFFTIPKPFRGHIGVIQRNAIRSWTLLRPRCDIILMGDDDGTAQAAAEFGVRHIPGIARNEYGTPLVSDLFAKAESLTAQETLCFINTDIMVMNDLLRAVARIRSRRFLMLGRRWDLDITEPWNFEDPDWEARLTAAAHARGELHTYLGVDYYAFPKGLWGPIPAFAVGRTAYDNWLIWHARSLGVRVIDATRVVTCIHQNHDRTYASLGMSSPGAIDDLTRGIEADRNRELAGGRRHLFSLRNANWLLTGRYLLPALTPWFVWERLKSRILLSAPDFLVRVLTRSGYARAAAATGRQ